MKRIIDFYLEQWRADPHRKPLLLRGARQVGKTYSVRMLGKKFEDYIEINFELLPRAATIFEVDLQPKRILKELSLLLGKAIIPQKTLLFFDEIQAAPKAFLALRYFYEMMPELHLIAAGSLLDFTTQELGIPVGRVSSLYMYPLSFLEFLIAGGEQLLAKELITKQDMIPFSTVIHEKLLRFVAHYLIIGGMPEVVAAWYSTHDAHRCFDIQASLLDTYRQDFGKYSKSFQVKYVRTIFDQIPLQMSNKFKYSHIEGEYRKRELEPAVNLLLTAGVAHKIVRTSGSGVPLGAQADQADFKLLFLDAALAQMILGAPTSDLLLNPLEELVNKGELVEAFVGQELLAYSIPTKKAALYYWQRQERNSSAEIDYLIQHETSVIPIEVKSGAGTSLKSMHSFLETYHKSPYGVRFSTLNYSHYEKLYSYPLYAVIQAIKDDQIKLNSII